MALCPAAPTPCKRRRTAETRVARSHNSALRPASEAEVEALMTQLAATQQEVRAVRFARSDRSDGRGPSGRDRRSGGVLLGR